MPTTIRPRTSLVAAFASLTLAALAPAAASAPTEPAAPRVDVRLVADQTGVAPGGTVRVGLRFELDPHWHIYWRHAGDAGQATEIRLEGPDGVDFSALQWPLPQRFETSTGVVTYGYERQVLVFHQVMAPAGALEGETIRLHATADWLVCNENCIPGQTELELALPVRSAPAPSPEAQLFERTAERVPGELPGGIRVDQALSLDGVRPGDPFEVVLQVGDLGGRQLEDPCYFPSPASGLTIDDVSLATAGDHVPPSGFLVRIRGKASSDPARTESRLDGTFCATRDGERLAFDLESRIPRLAAGLPVPNPSPLFAHLLAAAPTPALAVAAPEPALQAAPQSTGAPEVSPALMLLFAFLGGLILNVMPCVLPVLSIKVLGLVQQADASRKQIFWHGVAYTGGVLMSFAALAAMVIVAQQSGKLVGWGFQLQSPAFVAALGALVFVFGLSLFGVFEVMLPGADAATSAISKGHGVGGSFTSGIFATLLATPCTAPLLAPALGFALVQPPAVLVGYLLTVGLGLAFPFLLLAMMPAWARWMPRPGPWMETFKKVMGFLLVATTVWIVDILAAQVDTEGLVGYLAFLAFLSFGAWIYGHWGAIHRPTGVRTTALVAAVLVGVLGGVGFLSFERPSRAAASAPEAGEIAWRSFAGTDVEALARDGATVFIDFTADWCVTCKVYERTVIETDDIRAALLEGCVVPVKADYTREDDAITEWLRRFERPGVPMYVILPAGDPGRAILLPDVLTKGALIEGLKKAGASTNDTSCPT